MVTAAVLFFACTSVGPAQRVAGIDEFLKPIVVKIAADPNVGKWDWETNRNGGYLLRRLMDVTGDGRPEAFVASTLESTKHFHCWHVFAVANDGSLRPYEKILRHDQGWPVTEAGKTSLIWLAPPHDERLRVGDPAPYPVHRYSFVFPKIDKAVSWVSEEEHVGFQPADYGKLPKLEAILLADYLGNPDAKWSDATDLKQDAADCYYLEKDKERAGSNKAFTPQAALSKLGAVR